MAGESTAFDWTAAVISEDKFAAYSMNPNANNLGKHVAFQALGYALGSAEEIRQAAEDVIGQLRAALPPNSVRECASNYGRRVEIRTPLVGPNTKMATLVTVWQAVMNSNEPRLITNWAEVHK